MAHQQVEQYTDPALPLDNPKHDEFAFKYALLGNGTQAYLQTYECQYDTARNEAARLLAKPDVRSRIDFIQRCQTDVAFATLTRNLTAQKTIVHDENAILTLVEDPAAQISAATAILKANGRISNTSAQISVDQSTNYTLVNAAQSTGLEHVADKIIAMNAKLLERKAKPHNVIEAEVIRTNLT